VVRHGERADVWGSKQKIVNKADPSLSARGVKQALETGQFIRAFIGEHLPKGVFVEVKIEASPFLRTIATAAHIATEL
jgi:broad specificity phosphatase PhoE